MRDHEDILREDISRIIRKILELRSSESAFKPGRDLLRYAGAIYDHEEMEFMVKAILDGWFGVGKFTHGFEAELAKYLGVKKAVMTNSGSSANMIAVSALLSDQLGKDVRLRGGDEVITPALTFPTTLNPIIQNGLVPAFLDVNIRTYNIQTDDLKEALSKKTRSVFIPHTLGNPNDMGALLDFAEDNDLFLIEDACDALGSKYDGKCVGSFGSYGTFSFYPAHQITTGEGGAIVTNSDTLSRIALSMRDWGRACVRSICNPMHCPDKDCYKSVRYEETSTSDDLPEDYDKRYTYTNLGYNFQPTEIQAAMGLAQLKKLPKFIELRRRNFKLLHEELQNYEGFFILPESLPKSYPCWFAFPLTIRKRAPFRRRDIVQWLTRHKIEVKVLFSGNILEHPAYRNIECRVAQKLTESNRIMHNSFFLGVYPGITDEKMEYMVDVFRKFIRKYG